MPFSIVDAEPFRDMILYARGPKARESDIPHRTKMSGYVDDLADRIQENLQAEFKGLPAGWKISFTFDGWMSSTMIPFLGITAHYIDCNFKLQSVILFFGELSGSHSGENIATCLYNVLVKYGIVSKVIVLVFLRMSCLIEI